MLKIETNSKNRKVSSPPQGDTLKNFVFPSNDGFIEVHPLVDRFTDFPPPVVFEKFPLIFWNWRTDIAANRNECSKYPGKSEPSSSNKFLINPPEISTSNLAIHEVSREKIWFFSYSKCMISYFQGNKDKLQNYTLF